LHGQVEDCEVAVRALEPPALFNSTSGVSFAAASRIHVHDGLGYSDDEFNFGNHAYHDW
jgi:hypothetical protein